jgi:hypothetical protein
VKATPKVANRVWDGATGALVSGEPLEATEHERYVMDDLRRKIRENRGRDARAEAAVIEARKETWRSERRAVREAALVVRGSRGRPTAREHSSRASSTRSSTNSSSGGNSSSDDGPESPPSGRACRGCGGPLDGYHGRREWCDGCQNERGRRKTAACRKSLGGSLDSPLARYRDEIAKARRKGLLTPEEAPVIAGSRSCTATASHGPTSVRGWGSGRRS